MRATSLLLLVELLACSGTPGPHRLDPGDAVAGDGLSGGDDAVGGDVHPDLGDAEPSGDATMGDSAPSPVTFTVVTFNTGTSRDLSHGSDGDGYGDDQARSSEDYYGNGLAWQAAVDGTREFLVALQPDVVAFQELFYSPNCAQVPAADKVGFVCETWQVSEPTVVQVIVGAGYQVACHLGKTDKCVAVRQAFGSIRGCAGALCLDGLDGVPIANCGGGSRIGRGVIDVVGGGTITLVSVHGTSGFSLDDMSCRRKQIDQIFVDFDGAPAANGDINLIMGDFNTDPYRASIDTSAVRWLDFVGDGKDFAFVSDHGENAEPTYSGLLNIDYVVSDVLTGTCHVPGVTAGEPAVLDTVYFDHHPIVCDVSLPD